MADSFAAVYLHIVWATKHRAMIIPAALETDLHGTITNAATRLGCDVLAVGGTLDHVHLLVRFPRTVTIAALMERIKGSSSAYVNDQINESVSEEMPVFRWQAGYGVFSVGPNQTKHVIAYIENQKSHHAMEQLHAAWEPEPPDRTDKPSDSSG